jgi:hypothetical protein
MDGWEIARKDQVSLKNKIHELQQPRTSRVRSLRSPAEPALDLRARCSSVAIMASGDPLAGVKQTLKEKRTSETTALDFVPSWAGQLHSNADDAPGQTENDERKQQDGKQTIPVEDFLDVTDLSRQKSSMCVSVDHIHGRRRQSMREEGRVCGVCLAGDESSEKTPSSRSF